MDWQSRKNASSTETTAELAKKFAAFVSEQLDIHAGTENVELMREIRENVKAVVEISKLYS